MEKGLFREKSVEGLSAPDNLNDYIRVVKPSVWVTLIAVIVLLLGVTAWGALGKLDKVVRPLVCSDGNSLVAYISEKDKAEVLTNNSIVIDGVKYSYDGVEAFNLMESLVDVTLIRQKLSLSDDEAIFVISIDGTLPAGSYEGKIVVGNIRPISFVIN